MSTPKKDIEANEAKVVSPREFVSVKNPSSEVMPEPVAAKKAATKTSTK